jgi:hypothetical protein
MMLLQVVHVRRGRIGILHGRGILQTQPELAIGHMKLQPWRFTHVVAVARCHHMLGLPGRQPIRVVGVSSHGMRNISARSNGCGTLASQAHKHKAAQVYLARHWASCSGAQPAYTCLEDDRPHRRPLPGHASRLQKELPVQTSLWCRCCSSADGGRGCEEYQGSKRRENWRRS